MRYKILTAIVLVSILLPVAAGAMPMFARRIGRDCSYCHTTFPKLNETGLIYASNGYRFADEGEWPTTMAELKEAVPVALEIELEGVYNKTRKDGVWKKDVDKKIEEIEVMAGGSFGKTGRLSVLALAGISQLEGDDGSTDFRTFLGPLFLQVNDILGPRGEGLFNLKVGQWEIGLPFISGGRRVIHNQYFAETEFDLFTGETRAIEINGSKPGEEETDELSHRYAVGLTHEDNMHGERNIRGLYGRYSLSFRESYRVGAIFRHGKQADGPVDDIFSNRYGLAAEAEVGPAILTAGYFRSERSGKADRDNIMLESLYMPVEDVTLGARYDRLHEDHAGIASAYTASARYNITSKIYIHLEYRHKSDYDHVTSSNDKEKKARAYLVALF